MQTVTGLYDQSSEARTAVSELETAGIASSDISIVGRQDADSDTYAGEGAATGAGLGAVVGGGGGLLAGLGMLAIPGVGPVVAAGWLAATAAGAAAGAAVGGIAGGLVGSLTSAGVDENEAHVYAEGMRRGGTLVTARVSQDQYELARIILNDSNAVDVNARRAMYEEEGWSGFDENRPQLTEEEAARERTRLNDMRNLMP